ncbi:MAG: hypothetical protein KDD56_09975 [Bdellovibrionales bacterium]|nr:hypothetical protein [Bdellovibrionales bacterium]
MSIQQVIAQGVASAVPTNTTGASQAATAIEKDRRESSPEQAKTDETRSMSRPERVEAPFSPSATREVGDSTVDTESNNKRKEQELLRHKLDLTA